MRRDAVLVGMKSTNYKRTLSSVAGFSGASARYNVATKDDPIRETVYGFAGVGQFKG